MPRKVDPKIAEVLKEYGHGPEACWDCHGTWVVYHKTLEQIAAKAGIKFDQPAFVECDSGNGVAAMWVQGHHKDRAEWSIGEASPKNNKNAYPWAMAEKRAKDRVILKLIGLHGLAYSEEEADDFKDTKPNGSNQTFGGPLGKTELKTKMRAFAGDLATCTDMSEYDALLISMKPVLDQCERDMPDWWEGDGVDHHGALGAIESKRKELERNV